MDWPNKIGIGGWSPTLPCHTLGMQVSCMRLLPRMVGVEAQKGIGTQDFG